LLSAAFALNPAFGEAQILETGADLRPAFRDNVPRLVKHGRRLHLNGLFRHGYLMAPALADQAADYLETGAEGDLFSAH
jgi:glycine oxidase